jgi:protein gp37
VEVSKDGACSRCYAREFSRRLGLDLWGGTKQRKTQSDHYWNEPIRWNHKAEKLGLRRRVFCASMSDVFEARSDLDPWRARLWQIIDNTPNLDWQLLTKRPENMISMTPGSWRIRWPFNAWAGTTTATQEWYEHRMPLLARIPACVRFLSVEPMLGSLVLHEPYPNWVVIGGESGHGARLMEKAWALDLIAQCREAKVAVHFKQTGYALAHEIGCKNKAGKDPSEWPIDLRIQQFPDRVLA